MPTLQTILLSCYLSFSVDPSIALGYGVTGQPELNYKLVCGYNNLSINYESNRGINYNSLLGVYKLTTPELTYLSYSVGIGYGCIFREFGNFRTYKVTTELNLRVHDNVKVIIGWDADGRPELSKKNKHLRLNGTRFQFVGSVWVGVRVSM